MKKLQLNLFSILCFSLFLISCSEYENKFKNWIPSDNNPASPKVMYSIPAPGTTGIPKDQKIIIVFSKPIDEQSCIGAFSVQPSTLGLFEINGSILTFTASQPWQGGITYLANLTNRCEDEEGRDLAKPYAIDFSVSTNVTPPKVLAVRGRKNATGCATTSPIVDFVNFQSNFYSNTDVCVNSPIVVTFSKPMDRGSVESNFLTAPQLIGAFVWSNNNTVLEFRPKDALTTGVTYVLTIAKTAQDSSEIMLGTNMTASFTVGTETVKPFVTLQDGYVKDAGGCSPGTLASTLYPGGLLNVSGLCSSVVPGYQNSPISIDFSEDMNLSTTDAAVTISPSISGIKSWVTSANPSCGSTGPCGATSRLVFTPVVPWQHSVTYTVTISGASTDLAGNTIGTNYSFSFTVGSDFNIPRIVLQDAYINSGGGCVPGTLASALDPTNGIRDKTGACSGLTTGALNTPIFIHFSESVIQSSVENNITISPNILGTKSWLTSTNPSCGTTGICGNSSLFVFTPIQDWQNTTYTVTVPSSTMDLDGNTLGSPYSFSFTFGIDLLPPKLDFTTGPVLGDLAPTCGFLGSTLISNLTTDVCNLASGLKLRVRFNEPMNQAATTNAFSLSPAVNGVISWPTPTELLFTPSQDLTLFTQYKLTIGSSAKDIAGNTLGSDFISYFTTGNGSPANNTPPQVLNILSDTSGGPGGCDGGMDDSISPSFVTNVCTDNSGSGQGAAFEIIFSKNMDQNLTSQAFSISPSVSGMISWVSPTTMRFITTQSLNPNTQYIVSIGQNASDSNGIKMQNNYILYFLSSPIGGYPAVNSINVFSGTLAACQAGTGASTNILASTVNNGCIGNPAVNPIVVTFSSPMNLTTMQSGFSISPSVQGQFTFPSANQMVFTPDVALQYGKRYNITLSTSITDSSGKGLKNQVFGTFVVGALDSSQPSVTGVDFEQSGDGDDCGVTPNDAINMQTGTVTTTVCAGTPIIIHFSEAMDTSSVQNAFNISPSITGAITFSGNDMIITPSLPLTSLQSYTLSISTSAKDLAGNSLQSSFSLVFKAEDNSPQVKAIGVASQANCASFVQTSGCWWESGSSIQQASNYSFIPGLQACPSDSVTDNIVLVFNQSMDPVATVSAITISAVSQISVPAYSSIRKGQWLWSDSNRTLTISITDVSNACGFDMLFNTGISVSNYPLYLIQIDQSATNSSGLRLAAPFNFFFESN